MRKLTILATCLVFVSASLFGAEGRVVESSDMTLHTNVPYVSGGGERQQLDLYIPKRDRGGKPFERPMPAILWLHFGSWTRGSKEPCIPFGLGYTKKGYALVAANYRLTTTDPFPAQIEDCKSAVRWLRAHAAEYNIDPDRIGVWGVSAGGHLAALLGTMGDDRTFDVGENLE
ncbi:MAG: alpha/beta hydrolase fold domain-containing protein, partial [Thermoguttaceae bacterium]